MINAVRAANGERTVLPPPCSSSFRPELNLRSFSLLLLHEEGERRGALGVSALRITVGGSWDGMDGLKRGGPCLLLLLRLLVVSTAAVGESLANHHYHCQRKGAAWLLVRSLEVKEKEGGREAGFGSELLQRKGRRRGEFFHLVIFLPGLGTE